MSATERADIERLRAALADIFVMIDQGWLVRNTARDRDPTWAVAMLRFVARLKQAQDALEGDTR